MAISKKSDLVQISVHITKNQKIYLNGSGMQFSKFVRQAVEAHREGKWDYKFISDNFVEEQEMYEEQ